MYKTFSHTVSKIYIYQSYTLKVYEVSWSETEGHQIASYCSRLHCLSISRSYWAQSSQFSGLLSLQISNKYNYYIIFIWFSLIFVYILLDFSRMQNLFHWYTHRGLVGMIPCPLRCMMKQMCHFTLSLRNQCDRGPMKM